MCLRMTFLLALAIQCAALLARAGGAEAFTPASHPAIKETYLKLADAMEQHFRTGVLARWFPRCLDREHGGFLPSFNEDWSPGAKQDKTIVFQSRMTWVAAEVSRRLPDLAEEYRGYVRHGVTFLDQVMWDKEHGGFYWGLDRAGRVTEAYGEEKHLYGISFAIYGLSAAYRATQDPRALDLAQRSFRWLDAHAHDVEHGGYYEAYGPLHGPNAARPAKRTDALGTRYGFKSMNSHIHLLEALTELSRVWPDPQVKERLQEVFLVVRDRIVVEPGCMNLYFTRDWRAVPDHDSFGHDVETAYLLLEAAEALHQPDDPRTVAVARSLVDHALEQGWDAQRGGFYDKGAAFAPAWAHEKVWWTQAEGLNALLLMHVRFGKESPRYWAAFLKQWEFIWNHQVDHRHGEWYGTVSAEGAPRPGEAKGSIWKAAYHNGRALMNVSETLRQLAR
jgi:cellobiose epimerase